MKITEIQLQELKNLNDSRVNEILGVNTYNNWYKWRNTDFLMYIHDNGRYGFKTEGVWVNIEQSNKNLNKVKGYTLATHEEVEKALIKEAKRRGYENGNYKCLSVPCSTENVKDNYFYEDDVLWHGDYDFANAVFEDGKWAEIVDEKSEIKEEIKAIEERLRELRDKL